MAKPRFEIRPEVPEDLAALSALSARCFGPGRFARTAYRLREGAAPERDLCLTAWSEGALVGAIRFTRLSIGGADGALLLGPLAVAPERVGQGCGRLLIARGLEAARTAGHRLVLLVGDLSYYAESGFVAVPPGQITFPGPVDPARLLAAELEQGALAGYSGPAVSALLGTR